MSKCYYAGRYKIPEMFPQELSFPKGYTIVNHNETHLKIELFKGEKSFYLQYLAAGEAANIWLQSGWIFTADREFEIKELERP